MLALEQHLDGLDEIFFTSGRLKTFVDWPFNEKDNCSATKMSASGFYHIGGKDEPDLVQCFMCNKQLDGWEPEDDPWTVHKPDCLYISFGVKNEKDLTVRQFSELLKQFKVERVENLVSHEMTKIMEEQSNGRKRILEIQPDTVRRLKKKSN